MSRILAKSFKKPGANQQIYLKEHIEDIKQAFSKLKSNLNDDDLSRIIEFCIEKHDLGKVLPAFQIKHLKNKDYKPWEIVFDIPHSLFSVLWISDDDLNSFDEDTKRFVLSAIAFHHWRDSFENIISKENYELEKVVCELFSNENFIKDLQQNFNDELGKNIKLNERIAKSIANGSTFSKLVIPPYLNLFLPHHIGLRDEKKKRWILIAGFLQRCDHFASFCEEEGVSLDEIEIDPLDFNSVKNSIKNKINISDENKIWQIQKVKDYNNKSIILIAPTGYGKTEFAFLWSSDKKFIYTLPLRSAVNQIFERSCNIFGNNKSGILHSDADLYLLEKSKDAGDDTRAYELAKNLSYPTIISTGDQFFPYALKPPGYEKFYSLFSYTNIVIDEVQAYNPKACAIIVKFIEDVVTMGGRFLLMTATLPEFVKEEIKKRLKITNESCFEKMELNIYKNEKTNFEKIIKHKIKIKLIDNTNENENNKFNIPDEEINEIINNANKGKRVLIILNTVSQAQAVYKKLQDKFKKVFLIHSRFTLEDRRNKEVELIEREFKNPKHPDENEAKILVATQLVEASLDIDADILFTEICPLDSLVQRMGRIARRYFYKNGKVINKADNSEYDLTNVFYACNSTPNIYIWIFKKGLESGNGNVYEKELLKLSIAWLWKKSNGNIENLNFNKENREKFFNENFSELVEQNNPRRARGRRASGNQKDILKKIMENDDLIDKLQCITIEINEYEKYKIVELFYKSLPEDGKYLKDFYLTLEVLDAGWMSDKNSEAKRIFREIYDVQIVPDNLMKNFIEEIKKFEFNSKGYTHFKKEILSKFVISYPSKFSEREYISIIDKLMENLDKETIDKHKLERWLKGIYFIQSGNRRKIVYEKNIGLLKYKSENNDLENIL